MCRLIKWPLSLSLWCTLVWPLETRQTFYSWGPPTMFYSHLHMCYLMKPVSPTMWMLQSHLRDYTFNGLSQIFSFSSYLIWSFQTSNHERLSMRTHLSHAFHHFTKTCVCLMANLVLLNLTLFLTVHFCAVHGYAATHMCITHVLCFSSILPPPRGCIMSLISVMPALNSISRSDTNMYTQYDSI